jgi:hypothetical protein
LIESSANSLFAHRFAFLIANARQYSFQPGDFSKWKIAAIGLGSVQHLDNDGMLNPGYRKLVLMFIELKQGHGKAFAVRHCLCFARPRERFVFFALLILRWRMDGGDLCSVDILCVIFRGPKGQDNLKVTLFHMSAR